MGPFEGVALDGREATLLAGRVAIDLQAHRGGDGNGVDPRRADLDHLDFHVSDRATLDALRERLTTHGVACSAPTRVRFGWCVAFRDPDGVQLEFFARG